jgi:hypothetical protein
VRFIPFIVAAGFFVPPVLFAYLGLRNLAQRGISQSARADDNHQGLNLSRPIARGCHHLARDGGRTVPTALTLFIGLLVTATIVIWVSDAIRSARSGSGTGGLHLKHK